MKKIDWLVILLLIIISVVTLKDLFKPGFYTSHDGPHQVVRLYYFDQAIQDGQIPPRWAQGLLNGFGYPLFNFSYNLPWFIAEPIHLMGFSIFDSIKLTFLIGFLFSGITMFFYLKTLFGRLPAITGVVIYLFAPYRFSNIFVRAAIGDATSFIFMPLIFHSLYQVKTSNKVNWRWIIIGSLSLSAALLSHAMVFFFIFIAYLLNISYWFLFDNNRKRFIISAALMTLLSFGLSSYYFIPSLIEKNYTKFSQIINSVYFGSTFLDIKRLLYSPWGYGTMDAKEGAMSLQLGMAQWVVLFFSIITFILYFFVKSNKKKVIETKDAFFYLLVFFLSIIIMLPVSSIFWSIIKGIVLVDFPWRILPLTLLCISYLTAYVISRAKYKIILSIILIILAIYSNRNHLRINQTLDWTVPFFLQLEKTTNSYDEYIPKWVNNEVVNKLPKTKIETILPTSKVNLIKTSSNYLEFTLNSENNDMIRVNTIFYPGWRVYIDGKLEKINFENKGLIEFPVDRGNHLVKLKLEETPLRLISNLITIITGAAVLFLFVRYRKSNLI